MTQDYSGQNLRGRSFRGQNLAGANFSCADIRSTDFTGASLIGANFNNAKTGLRRRWAFLLVLLSWLLAGISGIFSLFNGALVLLIFDTKSENQISGWVALILFIVIFAAIIRQGINAAVAGAVAFVGAVAAAAVVAVAVAVAFAVAFAAAFAFAVAFAVAFAFVSSLPNIYIAHQALKGNEKYTIIRTTTIAFAAFGGTSFRNADLTDADFTQATLKSTDFRKAILIRTCFNKTKKLDRVRPGTTYLQYANLRQILITGQGQEKDFDRFDLRGVNFRGAYLTDASFVAADLSDACFQNTDLSRAKLVQAQLDGTDFTGATLTGAYIEDWNITHNTNFTGVRCEYIYMRLPTREKPDPLRKPDNNQEVFEDGDFGDFIQPIFDTLDLYHNQGVDPRAIAIAFKQLAENNPDAELEIVAMEKRSMDKFILRAKTAARANKSQLSGEYFDNYNHLKALPEQDIKLLLSEKDNQINRLENMVMTALERPSFYAQTYQNQGDTMPQHPKKESNFNLQNAQFGGGLVNADTVNAEQIGGNINNHGQNQDLAQAQSNNSAVKTILILAANPKATSPLRLDEEIREIDAGLQRAKKRELFDLKQRWAVRVQDVYQSLLDFKPQIVHFSGHGTGDDGLALEDDAGNVRLVDTVALTKLFELFAANVECVVLNACYSEVQAVAIAQHIPYVIGMNKAIGDIAAIKFSTGFYSALGAGESVEFAYKLGCNVIQLDGIPEHLTPVLKKKQ